jgi:hypothetical protein
VGYHGVLAVTVCAIGRIRILLEVGLTMTALEIIFCDLCVAIGTIHPPHSFARSVFLRTDVCVTLDTGDVFVRRTLNILFIDSKRDLLSFDCLKHIGLFMASEAFSV